MCLRVSVWISCCDSPDGGRSCEPERCSPLLPQLLRHGRQRLPLHPPKCKTQPPKLAPHTSNLWTELECAVSSYEKVGACRDLLKILRFNKVGIIQRCLVLRFVKPLSNHQGFRIKYIFTFLQFCLSLGAVGVSESLLMHETGSTNFWVLPRNAFWMIVLFCFVLFFFLLLLLQISFEYLLDDKEKKLHQSQCAAFLFIYSSLPFRPLTGRKQWQN